MSGSAAVGALDVSFDVVLKSMMAGRGQPSVPSSIRVLCCSSHVAHVMFLSGNGRGLTELFYTIVRLNNDDKGADSKSSLDAFELPSQWKSLVAFPTVFNAGRALSKEEELLRERMRETAIGVTSYIYQPVSNLPNYFGRILIPTSGKLYVCDVPAELSPAMLPLRLTEVVVDPVDAQQLGAKMDCKLSTDGLLLSFVRDNDLYATPLPAIGALQGSSLAVSVRQLTFSKQIGAGIMSGVAEYIMQEEFDRFTGYWLCPVVHVSGSVRRYKLLYLEVDESGVPEISIAAPSMKQSVDVFKFPRPGEANARSTVKLLTLEISSEVLVSNATLSPPLYERFPWCEYVMRADWTYHPSQDHFLLQLLDRSQKHVALVQFSHTDDMRPVVDGKSVVRKPSSSEDAKIAPVSSSSTSSILFEKAVPSSSTSSSGQILFETVSPIWINVNDLLYPLENNEGVIWASEHTGYRHLYLLRYPGNSNRQDRPVPVALTAGEDWQVFDGEIWVDESRKLLYFMSSKHSVLERHLYVTSFAHAFAQPPSRGILSCERLTDAGFTHSVALAVCPPSVVFSSIILSVFSNLDQPPACRIATASLLVSPQPHQPLSGLLSCFVPLDTQPNEGLLIHAAADIPLRGIKPCIFPFRPPALVELKAPTPTELPPSQPGSESPYFTRITIPETSKIPTLYGCVYLPPGVAFPSASSSSSSDSLSPPRLPLLLYVYGGPHVQLVTKSYSLTANSRYQMFASMGYAVGIVDGRGSFHRGLAFEGHIHHRMGQIEIPDQSAFVEHLVKIGLVDARRVAIFGWSYGGYATLLALSQRPDLFKLGISCAPVVNWEAYDTGYTERYMGTPASNPKGYALGSILSRVNALPDEENRLMLVHGLLDENVHFTHTASLLNALVGHNKPYVLKVFPEERHGLRSPSAQLYFEKAFLKFLSQYL